MKPIAWKVGTSNELSQLRAHVSMTTQQLKIELIEASAIEDNRYLFNLPNLTVFEQMEAHKKDFLPMCLESIRNDPQTPNETLARCYCRFCRYLEMFRQSLGGKI